MGSALAWLAVARRNDPRDCGHAFMMASDGVKGPRSLTAAGPFLQAHETDSTERVAADGRPRRKEVPEFISEDDLSTFEGWLRYQGIDATTTTPVGGLA
jgi:hypothetical protein